MTPGVCRACGCTDDDCSACIEATGQRCSWADEQHTLCTRCDRGELVAALVAPRAPEWVLTHRRRHPCTNLRLLPDVQEQPW